MSESSILPKHITKHLSIAYLPAADVVPVELDEVEDFVVEAFDEAANDTTVDEATVEAELELAVLEATAAALSVAVEEELPTQLLSLPACTVRESV